MMCRKGEGGELSVSVWVGGVLRRDEREWEKKEKGKVKLGTSSENQPCAKDSESLVRDSQLR